MRGDPFRVQESRMSMKFASVLAGCLALGFSGCGGPNGGSSRQVVVYTALDREFSEPLPDAYQKENGVRVLAKYDVESTKTVGLTQALIVEAARPRCDVFWNNEILNTIRLKDKGLLAPFHPSR